MVGLTYNITLFFFCGICLAYRAIVVKSGLSEDDHLSFAFIYILVRQFNSINKHRIDLENGRVFGSNPVLKYIYDEA